MKALLTALAAAALAAPVALGAGPTSQALTSANRDCALLKAKMGATAFAQAYSSFGKCVSAYAPVEQNNATSAQTLCSTEQADTSFAAAHGGKTFDQFYGTGKSGKNAFGRCVSTKTHASTQTEQQGRMNPAQTCRAQRTSIGTTAFNELWGKNGNKRNAFGKCVSATAHRQAAAERSASQSCKAEAGDATFASTHDGKSFAQAYGTNDLSNAFGKCVVTKAHASTSAK